MTYIILVAGRGTRLHPLTLKTPKTLFKLDQNTTVLQRMIRNIRRFDKEGEIVVVAGFLFDHIIEEISDDGVVVVRNPFYAITNSIASLWFAREYLDRDNVVIIDGDIVLENRLYSDFVCQRTDKPFVLVDSSCADAGDYNVQIKGEKICVMSKQLTSFYAEYVCLTKLDGVSSRFLKKEIEDMVNVEMYDQLFEDALVHMIFERDFDLYFKDIKGYQWTEVDCVDDLLKAKQIHSEL